MTDEKSTVEQMAAELDAEFSKFDRNDETDPFLIGKYMSDDDIDALLDLVESTEDLDHVDVFFQLRKCFKRDFELSKIMRVPQVIQALYAELAYIITLDEFRSVERVFSPVLLKMKEENEGEKQVDYSFTVKAFWDNILSDAPTLDDLKTNIAKNFNITYYYSISGVPTKKADISYKITDKGIIKEMVPADPNKPVLEYKIWEWDEFQLLSILKDESETETVYRYNYLFNGDIFMDKSLEWMRENIYTGHCKSMGKDKQIFGMLIRKYQKDGQIPVLPYSGICGFTKDGWRMPDKYYIKFSPAQGKIRRCLNDMSRLRITMAEGRDMMHDLYENVSLVHRDILFAHAIIMPFLYALRSRTDILFWLSLGSPKFNTGKTPAAIMITCKIWNNLPDDRNFITKDQASSESRLGDYLTASTFGITIDECGDLSEKIVNTLKSYITGDAGFSRKDVDQTYKIDRSFTSPLILTFNSIPPIMDDLAFLGRGIHIPVDEIPTEEEVEKFKKAWEKIPRGYIGKYIYEKTRDLTLQELVSWFEMTPKWNGAPTPRSNMIYRLLHLGKMLMNELFGIQLDLSQVPVLILKTLQLGSDDIFTIIQLQIADAVPRKVLDEYSDEYKLEFSPTRKWITAPLYKKQTEKFNGLLYTADNLQDLYNRLHFKMKLDLPTLATILQKRWDGVYYTTVKHDKKPFKCVYIPMSVFEEKSSRNKKEGKNLQELTMLESKIFTIIENMKKQINNPLIGLEDLVERMAFETEITENQIYHTLDEICKKGYLTQEMNAEGLIFYK